jgi:hypothetical protein
MAAAARGEAATAPSPARLFPRPVSARRAATLFLNARSHLRATFSAAVLASNGDPFQEKTEYSTRLAIGRGARPNRISCEIGSDTLKMRGLADARPLAGTCALARSPLLPFARGLGGRCATPWTRPSPSPPPPRAAAGEAAASTAPPEDAETELDLRAEEERYERFRKAFQEAQTMSQLYNIDRPPPVPLEEFEKRRVDREQQEVVEAARRLFPNDADAADQRTREALAQLDTLVPGVLDLAAMTAREYALLCSDVRGAAARVVALRVAWPRADVGRVLRKRPKMLLPPDAAATLKRLMSSRGGRPAAAGAAAAAAPASRGGGGGGAEGGGEMAAAVRVAKEAASVRLALEGGSDPASREAVRLAAERGGHGSVDAAVDAVIEAAPELMDPLELSRALAFVRTAFPASARHPAALLAENPRLLLNLAESDMDDSAEYGEITTRF